MHGVRRTKPSESLAARRQKEAPKISEYQTIVQDLLAQNRDEVHDQASFDLTSRALKLNPELYTAWNFRRRVLLNLFKSMSPEDQLARLLADINLTTLILKSLPKVYWIWNHRLWCLSHIPCGPAVSGGSGEADRQEEGEAQADTTWRREAWEKELLLVDKMLTVDPRNFHAWDYRRHVLLSLASLSTDPPDVVQARQRKHELAFTQKKIESNFSNFSAWHQRMRVLGTGPFDSDKDMDDELELVNQALWTDPNDQSSWLYHRFLITKTDHAPEVIRREMTLLRELHELESNAKWPMDTLVHYASLLLLSSSSSSSSSPADEEGALREDIRAWLKRLEEVDGKRAEKYRAVGARLLA